MCESNFRRALLEQPFRVWHSGSVGEYDVTLTPVSVILRPRTPGKGGGAAAAAAAASCCSRICSRTRSAKIEVFGRDLLSCRPAHGAPTDTKFEMGPPLFMLIAYPSLSWSSNKTKVNSSKKRTVLYFHWISKTTKKSQVTLKSKWRGKLAANSEGFQDQTDFAYFEEDSVAEMLHVKEEWVRLIHECFLPQKRAALHGHCLLNQSSSSSAAASASASILGFGQKLLVILNPVSGGGGALRVFKDRVIPVFRDSGTNYEVLVSEYPGHAYDVVRRENLARWRGVVAVSGDGLVAEVFRGLFDRADWQDSLAHLAVSAVPVGRRNAFARSLTHAQAEDGNEGWSGLLSSARAQLNPLDLFFVQTDRHESRVGVLNVGWGIISDQVSGGGGGGGGDGDGDGEAEGGGAGGGRGGARSSYGIARFFLARLLRVSSVKSNSAVLSYLPIEGRSRRGSSASSSNTRNLERRRNHDGNNNIPNGTKNLFKSNNTSPPLTCSTCSITGKEHNFKSRTPHRAKECSPEAPLIPKPKPKRYQSPPSPPPPPPPPPMLAPQQPSGSRYNYTSLLTEGQLYFRSWQELDVRLRHSGPFPMLNNHPGLMKPSGSDGSPRVAGPGGGGGGGVKRPKPHFPNMPDLPSPLPSDAGWVTEVGDFVSVHLLNHGFVDKSNRLLVSECLPDDGVLWLLLVRAGISRKDLLGFLRSSSLDRVTTAGTGAPTPSELPPGIDIIPVRGFRLAPLTATGGAVTVDGEPVNCNCIQAFIMPGVARTMVR